MRPAATPTRFERWLHRLATGFYVLVCMEMGIILLIAPWTSLWVKDGLLIPNLALRDLLMRNFVRGVVSGLGLINLWLGATEIIASNEKKT